MPECFIVDYTEPLPTSFAFGPYTCNVQLAECTNFWTVPQPVAGIAPPIVDTPDGLPQWVQEHIGPKCFGAIGPRAILFTFRPALMGQVGVGMKTTCQVDRRNEIAYHYAAGFGPSGQREKIAGDFGWTVDNEGVNVFCQNPNVVSNNHWPEDSWFHGGPIAHIAFKAVAVPGDGVYPSDWINAENIGLVGQLTIVMR